VKNIKIKPIEFLEAKSENFRSGCGVLEVSFVSPRQITKIEFSNFYTASLSIKAKIKAENNPATWKIVLKDFVLMPHPHLEEGSQNHFTLKADDFKVPLQSVISFRLILFQPSPNWLKFNLEDLNFYQPLFTSSSITNQLNSFDERSEEEKNQLIAQVIKSQLPDPQIVSQHLQKLWILTEKVSSDHPPSGSLGRFDLDGSYDVSMLTYN